MRHITIVGINNYFGREVFRVNQTLYLSKDLENIYDEEAIQAQLDTGATVGYVANSIFTVASGTQSAGRIYDVIQNKQKVIVRFIVKECVIAEVIETDESDQRGE